jgi:hypothetical protein
MPFRFEYDDDDEAKYDQDQEKNALPPACVLLITTDELSPAPS